MGAITAAMVRDLRERTGVGMMECKKALVAAEGDIDRAIEEMRKAGQAKAVKKASRTAAEGTIIVRVSDDAKQAVMLEVNCETDFVARDENFLNFSESVADAVLSSGQTDLAAIAELALPAGESIEVTRKNLVAKIGENIHVRRAEYFSTDAGTLGAYVHGGRIGVLVDMSGESNPALAKDIAMHVAATQPIVVKPEEVPQAEIDKEKAIFVAQAEESGKPADIIEKMIGGRLKKFLDEVSLCGQPFVKDPNKKVGQLLKEASADVVRFVRYAVGEGIEKEETDFVKEVMEQAKA